MKKVKDVMSTPAKFCRNTENLQDVAKLMAKNNLGSFPVLDSNNKVSGVITDRDVCLALGKGDKENTFNLTVNDVMSKKVHCCSPEDEVTKVLKTMRTEKIGRLPVLDNNQELKGVVTLMSIVKKTQGSKEESELVYNGEENIIKTLHSLAERDSSEYAVI